MIIDGKGKILGRLATFAAKQARLGHNVDIINCDEVVISGDKKLVFAKYKTQADRHTQNVGPFLPKTADRFVRRAIRGMTGYKTARGAESFKRIMCHIGVPAAFEGKETTDVAGASAEKLPNLKYVKVKEITEHLRSRGE